MKWRILFLIPVIIGLISILNPMNWPVAIPLKQAVIVDAIEAVLVSYSLSYVITGKFPFLQEG